MGNPILENPKWWMTLVHWQGPDAPGALVWGGLSDILPGFSSNIWGRCPWAQDWRYPSGPPRQGHDQFPAGDLCFLPIHQALWAHWLFSGDTPQGWDFYDSAAVKANPLASKEGSRHCTSCCTSASGCTSTTLPRPLLISFLRSTII